ncbi:hypothetical protein P154DRAFT_537292 [Amniculicola lignicola CBS 123094]|uniref:Uncharacterized protein n=1 Tax=Amniculicola lignicola CBS 123094 TaxID=1392246 RepID=A0A6A5W963_9PLEO|nr:hypothetical protein P154DRAFT_537292 [Amniculicola lignicola CBS 123094]
MSPLASSFVARTSAPGAIRHLWACVGSVDPGCPAVLTPYGLEEARYNALLWVLYLLLLWGLAAAAHLRGAPRWRPAQLPLALSPVGRRQHRPNKLVLDFAAAASSPALPSASSSPATPSKVPASAERPATTPPQGFSQQQVDLLEKILANQEVLYQHLSAVENRLLGVAHQLQAVEVGTAPPDLGPFEQRLAAIEASLSSARSRDQAALVTTSRFFSTAQSINDNLGRARAALASDDATGHAAAVLDVVGQNLRHHQTQISSLTSQLAAVRPGPVPMLQGRGQFYPRRG